MTRDDRTSTNSSRLPREFLQPLERRVMLTTITLTGTEGADAISVAVEGGSVVTVVNGTMNTLNDAEVTGILINALGGDDEVSVESNGDNPTTVNGGNGFDTIWLAPGAQDLDQIDSTVLVNGGAGFDLLSFFDANETTDVSFSVLSTAVSRTGAPAVLHQDVEMLPINTGSGADTVQVNTGHVVRLDTGPGTDTIDVVETGTGGMSINASAGDDIVRVNADGAGTARVLLVAQRIGSLTIGAGGNATIIENITSRVLVTASLTLSGTAVLDASEFHVVVDYTGPSPLEPIRAALTSGYNGGAWNGPGINSMIAALPVTGTALGYAEASAIFTTFPATFAGQQVDDTSVLIRHTFYGDADLSGSLSLDDFNALAANFGAAGRQWFQGDFDFNGHVNLNDFNLLAEHFGEPNLRRGAAGLAGTPETDDERAELV